MEHNIAILAKTYIKLSLYNKGCLPKKIAQKVTLEHSQIAPPSPKPEWDKRNWDIKHCSLTPSPPLAMGTN